MTKRTEKLISMTGVSITPRRGMWRVKLGIKITGSKPIEKLFKREGEACTYAESWIKDRNNRTQAAKLLSDSQMESTYSAYQVIKDWEMKHKRPIELTMVEIVRKYVATLPANTPLNIEEMGKIYKEDREKWGTADHLHLGQCRYTFEKIHAVIGDVHMHELTTEDIEDAMDVIWGFRAPKTYNNNLTNINALFNLALLKGHVADNVCSDMRRKKVVDKEITVFTPKEIKTLLDLAKVKHTQLYVTMALQCFAGIRLAEAMRLTWGDLRSDHVVVSASKAKNSQRRTVPILPPLERILSEFKDKPDNENICTITMRSLGKPRERIAKEAEIEWKHNALRHSFVTYRLIDLKNDNQVALEAGHTTDILHQHYKALIKDEKKVATKFWKLY